MRRRRRGTRSGTPRRMWRLRCLPQDRHSFLSGLRQQVDYQDIYTEGITKITAEDIKYAQAIGVSIKLLATSRRVEGGVYAMVSPVMIGASNPLYSVSGVFNAIFVHGNMLGDAMFYGSGARKAPHRQRCGSRCGGLCQTSGKEHPHQLGRGQNGTDGYRRCEASLLCAPAGQPGRAPSGSGGGLRTGGDHQRARRRRGIRLYHRRDAGGGI